MIVVTPTDRLKSACNCCVIDFLWLFVLSLCPFDISVGIIAFVIGLSQIFSFFSSYCDNVKKKLKREVYITLRILLSMMICKYFDAI